MARMLLRKRKRMSAGAFLWCGRGAGHCRRTCRRVTHAPLRLGSGDLACVALCCAARANAGLQLAIGPAAAIVQSIAWGGSCDVMSGWEAEAMARSDDTQGSCRIHVEGGLSPWRGPRRFGPSGARCATGSRAACPVPLAAALLRGPSPFRLCPRAQGHSA